jgi:NAD(P)-dependent dehydrogenase (short-subunit alcohol dehydrogenase family)
MAWVPASLPERPDAVFVVTGGSAGLGYFAAEQVAATGATVVVTGRTDERVQRAAASIRGLVPDARVVPVALDLTDPGSVRAGAERIGALGRLDGLALNAGSTVAPRERRETPDGHEWTFATNVLGHVALTAHLWPVLTATPGARIVGLGSLATVVAKLDPLDLQSAQRYAPFRAYAQSKHAMHGFVLELDRRVRAAGPDVAALLAHPGYAVESLSPDRPGITHPGRFERLPFAQGKRRGAAPTVRALLDPDARGGMFFGPRWRTRGRPVLTEPVHDSATPAFGRLLWERLSAWTAVPPV